MFSLPVLAGLAANVAVLMTMPHASLGHGTEIHNPTDVGFRATFCDPAKPLEDGCEAYLGLVFVNESRMTWGVSDAVPNVTISIYDAGMKPGREGVLATLDLADGRLGVLTTTNGTSYFSNATMGVQELASHMCMGHIFAEYENEQYRIDSYSGPEGCKMLMGGADHSSDAGHSDDMPMGDMPMGDMPVDGMAMVDGIAEGSGVHATVGAAIVFLFGLALM